MLGVNVTLLYFDDCPSWRDALAHLDVLAHEFTTMTVRRILVDTPDAAVKHRFCGSPSIHLDGYDLFADPDAPVGLACRIYQTPNGPAGSPSIEQLRQALHDATAA